MNARVGGVIEEPGFLSTTLVKGSYGAAFSADEIQSKRLDVDMAFVAGGTGGGAAPETDPMAIAAMQAKTKI